MFGQSVEESAEENAMSVVEETAMSAFTMEQTGAFEETGIQFQLPGLNNMSAVMSDGTGTSVPWADALAPVATTCRPLGLTCCLRIHGRRNQRAQGETRNRQASPSRKLAKRKQKPHRRERVSSGDTAR